MIETTGKKVFKTKITKKRMLKKIFDNYYKYWILHFRNKKIDLSFFVKLDFKTYCIEYRKRCREKMCSWKKFGTMVRMDRTARIKALNQIISELE